MNDPDMCEKHKKYCPGHCCPECIKEKNTIELVLVEIKEVKR